MKLGKGKINCSLGASNANVDNCLSSEDANVFLKERSSSCKGKIVSPGIASADLSKILSMFRVLVTGNVMYDSRLRVYHFMLVGLAIALHIQLPSPTTLREKALNAVVGDRTQVEVPNIEEYGSGAGCCLFLHFFCLHVASLVA